MRTVADYIQLVESEGAVNVVSSGAVATKDVPLGKVQKRKTVESVGTDPLAHVYAPVTDADQGGVTAEDDDEHKRRMFHLKQQHTNDQVSSL